MIVVHGGFNLLGLDVPEVVEESEGVLRVIAAVERDGEVVGAPKVVLILRDLTTGRSADVRMLTNPPEKDYVENILDGPFTVGIAVRLVCSHNLARCENYLASSMPSRFTTTRHFALCDPKRPRTFWSTFAVTMAWSLVPDSLLDPAGAIQRGGAARARGVDLCCRRAGRHMRGALPGGEDGDLQAARGGSCGVSSPPRPEELARSLRRRRARGGVGWRDARLRGPQARLARRP